MFRCLQSGLPKDPIFPTDLEGLGYFINDKDEIRNVQNPQAYFKFFLTKNDRYNILQRESMNEAIRKVIAERLIALNLEKIRLPLNATEAEPHVPIFISSDLKSKKRVVVLFYEDGQDIGVFAHRIIGGRGGINEGSAVNLVKYIQSSSHTAGTEAPGVILANMGQLRWWRKGKKAVTAVSWHALPQKSAVDFPFRFDEVNNSVPGNRTTAEHVNYIFNHVVAELVDPEAKLDVIGVSVGAVNVSEFLNDECNFEKWGKRINTFAAVATFFNDNEITNEKFGSWLKNRGRAYQVSRERAGYFLAGPEGYGNVSAYGCPVFSLGEPYYTETLLPGGYKEVIDWFHEVAGDDDYVNPKFARCDAEGAEEVADWGDEEFEEPLELDRGRVFELLDEDEESELTLG